MGTEPDQISATTLMAWRDRGSRDLQIPYHEVRVKHFNQWQERAFKADGREFEAKNLSEADHIRLLNLTLEASFRK